MVESELELQKKINRLTQRLDDLEAMILKISKQVGSLSALSLRRDGGKWVDWEDKPDPYDLSRRR